MSSKQPRNDGGADNYATITDEKKRKRMISNRESARRSRMKREQHIKDLNEQITYFTKNMSEVSRSINEIGGRYAAVESENRVLREHAHELKGRLESLEKMLLQFSCYNNNNGGNKDSKPQASSNDEFSVTGRAFDDHLLKPWMKNGFQSQAVDGIYQF